MSSCFHFLAKSDHPARRQQTPPPSTSAEYCMQNPTGFLNKNLKQIHRRSLEKYHQKPPKEHPKLAKPTRTTPLAPAHVFGSHVQEPPSRAPNSPHSKGSSLGTQHFVFSRKSFTPANQNTPFASRGPLT